jgi:hypothetical protein
VNFKKVDNRLSRLYSNSGRTYGAFQMGIDAAGKPIVIGVDSELVRDSLFTNGSASNYGKGSIAMMRAGGIRIVDADGLWQTPTITTVSQSASPSASVSPSASLSPSASASLSPSPSASVSLSPSPSASVSPSASESPSPSASPSPST